MVKSHHIYKMLAKLVGGKMSVNHDMLKNKIIEAVKSSQVFLPFEKFMQMALFEPELGYYESRHVRAALLS